MSAGGGNLPQVNRDHSLLAPNFRDAVATAIDACHAAGLDARVYEGFRSQELQALYYQRGRTIIPPTHTVTNAPTSLQSWHGFGLAVDVISTRYWWEPPDGEGWFRRVATIFKANHCKWGGDWTKPDTPHFQWHLCKPSPSDRAREILRTDGLEALWKEVGAA